MSKHNGKNATSAAAVSAVNEEPPLPPRVGPGEGISTAQTTHPITLRLATRTDREPLQFFFDTALRKDYFMRRGQLEDMLNGPHHQVFVAEIDNVLVGVAITTRGTRLVNALVHPAYRGLGIGQALIGYTRATEVRAKLDMSTGDPRGFYTALGFQPTVRKNGKRNNGRTNLEVMQRPHNSPPSQGSIGVAPVNGLGEGAERRATAMSAVRRKPAPAKPERTTQEPRSNKRLHRRPNP